MNKMGIVPVNKLLITMGVPMILSMVLQAVYNIVDSAFVSNMSHDGEAALNALTLAFPVQMLMVAISIGTGVGTNALLSKALGQRDSEKVNRVAGNSFFLAIIICVAYIIFGLTGVRAYICSQTSNKLIQNMAIDYLNICCIISFGIVFFSIFEKLLQATGRSMFSTIAQISGAIVNIVLDPIMIYGLLSFPEMGVKGAAYATVIGQCVSCIVALIFHIKVNKEISNKAKYIKPSWQIIKEIYDIGLPAIIAQALMSVMTYGLNIILGILSEAAVTAYGLFYKIQQFMLFAAFGLRDAITPIISFNHGMKSKERIQDGIKFGMIYTISIMLIGTLLLELFAEPFAEIFGLSGDTKSLCLSAMRIISVSFVFAGANIAFQGIFQALESGTESLVVSIFRQLILVLPVAWIFVEIIKNSNTSTDLVWYTFLIAEAVSTGIACIFMKRTYNKKIKVLTPFPVHI